jgi:hypothetical protein
VTAAKRYAVHQLVSKQGCCHGEKENNINFDNNCENWEKMSMREILTKHQRRFYCEILVTDRSRVIES